MMEWDADATGSYLFLANGYGGILVVDYRDPASAAIHRAVGLGGRNVWANDLWWDAKRRRLYAATSRGLQCCALECEDLLRCENFFPPRPIRRAGPNPPKTLRGVVAKDTRYLLGLRALWKQKAVAVSLYDRDRTDSGAMPAFLGEANVPLPPGGVGMRNVRYDGERVLIPTRRGLAIVDSDSRLLGCVDTAKIYRFVLRGRERIVAAQGEKGIREWRLRVKACRNPKEKVENPAP
jgi:hypothetical protein